MPVLGPGSLSLESPLKITKALQRANNLSVLQSYSPSMEAVQPVGQFFSSDSKYDEGMPFAHIRDIDKYRASRQPWYEQAGAMVGQAVVGEVIGGTIMSIGSIFDTPEMLYNTIAKEDDDFHNFIYDIGKGISDFSREEMPIYQSGDRFGDPGWWFQNGVSVASTLSMLIPGMVAARAGKAIGTGLRLGTTATNLLETGIGAATMRHSENFREASQVYDETLQLGQLARQQGKIDKTDDEIKHIASNAAALDYNTNWANFAFDFIQLGSILKPFKDLTRNTGLLPYKLAKAEGKLPKGKLGKVAYWMAEPGKGILEQSSEGLEEVVNQVSQYEGTRKGNIDLGLIPDDGTTLGDRLGDYLTRPETVDAFIWGTIGGLMFKPMAKVLGMDRTDQQLERKLGELAGRENTIKEYAKHIDDVKNNRVIKDKEGRIIQDFTKATPEDKENFVHDITRKMGFNLGINFSSAGNVDLGLEWLDSPTTHQSLIDSGVTTKENLQSDIKGIKDEVLRAERLYTKNFQRLYESPIQDATKRRILNKAINIEYNRENNLETIKNLETEYTRLHNEDPFIQQNMSNPAIENTIKQAGLGIAIATLKNDLTEAKAEGNTYAVERIEKILPILEKKLENIGKVETVNPKLLDFRLTQNIAQQELLKEYNNILAEDLSNVDSKENITKVDEEVKNDEKTIQDAITRNKKSKEQDRKDERLQQEKQVIKDYEANRIYREGLNEEHFNKRIQHLDDETFTSTYESLRGEVLTTIDNALQYLKDPSISQDEKTSLGDILKREHRKLRFLEERLDKVSFIAKSTIPLTQESETTKLNKEQLQRDINQERINEATINDIVDNISEDGREFIIRGKKYYNLYSFTETPTGIPGAINRDSEGNIISVTLQDETGKNFTFREEKIVDAIAYTILLQELSNYESTDNNVDLAKVDEKIDDLQERDEKTSLKLLQDDLYEIDETLDYIDKEIKQFKYEYSKIGYSVRDALQDPKVIELVRQKEELQGIKKIVLNKINKLTGKSNEEEHVKAVRRKVESRNKKDVKREISKGEEPTSSKVTTEVQPIVETVKPTQKLTETKETVNKEDEELLGNFSKMPNNKKIKSGEIETHLESKVSSDGEIRTIKNKTEFVDKEFAKNHAVSTQYTYVSTKELENIILDKLSSEERELWEYYKEGLDENTEWHLLELRLPTDKNPNKISVLQVRSKEGLEYSFRFTDNKTTKEPTPEFLNEQFDKLTISNAKLEQESEKIVKSNIDDEYVNDTKHEDIEKSIDKLDQSLKDDNGSKSVEDGEIIYENSKIENGHNALAHLDREYERIKEGKNVRYADKTNQLSDKAPKEILNPDKFGVGTEVTFVVDDKDDVEIYDPRKEGKELTTWGEYKQWLRDNNKNVDITTLQEYKDNVPIRLTHNGNEYNAFLHSASWINEENIKSNVEKDKENIRLIRDGIIKDGKFTTTINSRTNGVLFRTIDGKKLTLRESVGEDPNYTLGVMTSDGVRVGKGKLFNSNLINKSYTNGATALVVKVNGSNYIAIPITRNKIGSEQLGNSIVSTVITALNIFLDNDINHPLRMAILNSKENGTTGDDITTPKGLNNFVHNFVYSYKSKSTDLDDLVKTRSISTTSNDRYFSIRNGVIYLFDGTLTGRTISVSRGGQKFREEFFNKLSKSLPNFFMNTNVQTLGNDRRVALLNESGEVEFKNYKDLILDTSYTNVKGNQVDEVDGKPVFSYTIQPVIRFDFSKFIKQEETKVESPIDKPNPTPQDFKDMVNNFDPLESFSLGTTEKQSKYLVKELGVYHQEVITNHIFRNIVRDIINTPDVDKNLVRNKWLSQFKEKMESMKELYTGTTDPKAQVFMDRIVTPTLNNFETISRLVNIKLLKVNNLIGDVNDDVDLEYEDSEGNERAYNDRTQYEDKTKTSAEVKRQFAVLDGDRKNFFGEYNIVDYQEVDNIVKGILAGLDPDFELMMGELEKYVEAHPWIRQLVDNLRNSPKNLQNMFATEMNMHHVEHMMVMWEEDKKTGFKTNLQVNNENAVKDQVMSNWKSNLLNSGLVDDEHRLIDVESIKKEYDEFKTSKDMSRARAWLEKLGVNISDGLWNTIMNDKYKDGKKEVNAVWFINSSYSPINHLYKKISNLGSKSLDDVDILNETSIKKLAREESKFNSDVHSTSHRSGGKTVNSYGKNKFLVDWQRYLMNQGVAGEIMKSPFHSTSLLLNAIDQKDKTGEDNPTTKNLQMAVVSLQAIKKHGTKDKENMELHNLGDDEYEMFNMGTTFSSLTDELGEGTRVIAPVFPTTSDKSTAHMYKWTATKIGLNTNATLDQASKDMIYTQCILPEIRRIKYWENVKNGGGEFRTKEFATGGHMFHMIPAMNNIQGIWNADGTININVESIEFRKNIDSLIDDVIDTLVHDKLDKWREYGFVTVDKDSNLQPTMINLKILDEKGVLEGVAKENYVKAAATDMVYQHLIYNANMFTGIIGDPAHIFKSKVFKGTITKMVKDGTLTTEQSKDVAYTWSKLTPEQRVQVVGNVFDNVGKRLAGTIAPRKQGANTTSSTIRYMMANDKAIDSKSIDQYKALLGDKEASEYSSTGMLKESTNAQEFTTMLEHLSNMENAGLLPDGFYNEISEIITREIGKGNYYYTNAIRKGLSKDNLEFFNNKLVLQVTKPVYYWNELSGKEGLVPVYVKTSAYPLLPELTVGNQMDKIRILMESKGIDRLTFGSGTKLGMPTKPISIWGSDGNVKEDFTDEEIEASTVLADRRGFGFQQEVPYEELKDAINRVSQADKNLFTNILSIDGFIYDGKSYKGNALREEYNRIYGDLYDIGYKELVHEIDVKFDEQGNVVSFDREKVKQILMDEAVKRDYPLNDIDGLDLDEALDFIAFMPSSDKYEALLSSIVKNRVLKMKFRGKSLVLSTEEGYQQDKSKPYEELTKDEKSGITYTNNFKDELDPGHFEDKDGNRLTGEQLKKAWKEGTVIVKRPAQVLLPWKFQWYNKSTKRNEILDITKFVGEDGRIDNSKLPTELLYALGMRIPNQGHNSQSWVEIVGFLPRISGDIVVAPRDFLAQMGSDFDVDKLYSYMYNYFYSESKGTLSRFKMSDITPEEIVRAKEGTADRRFQEFLEQFLGEEYEDTIQEEISDIERLQDGQRKFDLQNRLLDIHIAIQANTNPLVQKQIYEPLGFWEFKGMADEIANAQSVDPYFIPISDEYQKQRRISAAMGKTLVGDMANGLMFISASQGKKLQLHTGGIDPKPFYVRFGNKTSNGDLSNPFTIDTIEKLIKSAGKAKGNYKEVRNNIDDYIPNVLDYLNIEEIEFRSQVMSGLLSAAVDNQNEQILDKINLNPKTSKYTKMLVMLGFGRESAYLVRQPIIVDYFNKIKSLRSTLGGYNINAEDQAYEYVMNKYTPADFDNKRYEDEFGMGKGLSESNMKKSILSPDNNFNYIQHAALEQLLYIESHANKLQFIQSAINTDSKGLDKSLLETISKEDAIDRIRNSNIFNVTSILDNSIWGYATEKGLKFNNKLWSNIFPYKQQGLIYMFDRIEQMVGKDEASTQTRAALRSDIWKSFKSYIYSLQQLGLYSGNIDAERNRLMMGENNLASTINKIKKSSQWANHPFISRLDPQVKKNLPSLVFMDAKLDQAGEMLVMQSALDLYMNDRPIEGTNYTTRKLFQDLVSLAYLNGGIQGAVQYLRFLPISYLFDSGMATTVQGMVKNKSFEDTEFMDIPHEGMPYWVVPNFILNYVQHNTRGLTHLKKNTKEEPGYKSQVRVILEDNNLITNVKATKFALTDTNVKVARIVNDSPAMVAPEFLIIPDDGRKGKVDKNVLFMYTGETTQDGYPIYYRIPNKGIFAMDEYTYSQGLVVTPSLINIYNTTNKFAKKEINFPEETQGSTTFTNQEVSETNHLDLLKIVKKGDTKSIQNILTQISLHSESPFNQVLAKEMVSNIDGIKGVKFDSTTTREGVAGVYSNGTVYVNLKDDSNSTLDGLSETILHEVQHAFVNEQVVKYLNDPKSVHPEVKKAIVDMIRIQSIFKSRLISEIGQEKYNELVSELNNIKNKKGTGRYSREDLNLVHATEDIREFFTLSLTNGDIQKKLNEIDDPESKVRSLLDRVIDSVKKMLEAIGFKLNNNSLLVGAIENNITMIRNSRPVGTTSVQPTQLKMFEENKPRDIYSKLGNKTQSENVVITPWSELKDAKEPFTRTYGHIVHIISTRIKNSNEHFGNPFSHDPAGKVQGLIKTATIKEAVEKYIDWVINSEDSRAKWIRGLLETGELKDKPILYYKELGEPSHATALDYLINKYDWSKGETIETLSLGIPTQQQVLKQFDQLNEDGTKKKKLVNDENYKRMIKEAQKINAGQSFYKATVGTIYGEEATIRSGRQYYVIQLNPRELTMRDRYNAISDKDVMDRIRKCRK